MVFKKEDLGLYFAMMLIGGGGGLIAGAFITAQINKKREEAFNAEEAARDENWPPEEAVEQTEEEAGYVQAGPATHKPAGKEVVIDMRERELQESETPRGVPPKKIHEPKRSHLSKDDQQELARLLAEYDVTPMQIDLIESGTMTVEELEGALAETEFEKESISEITRTDYNEPYRDEKPSMDALLGDKLVDDGGPRDLGDLLVVVGNKWEISIEPPEGKNEQKKRTIYFDPIDESVFMMSASGHTVPADLRVITTPEVRELIMPWLLFEEEIESIYLTDVTNKKARWYEIAKVVDVEDADEDDARP